MCAAELRRWRPCSRPRAAASAEVAGCAESCAQRTKGALDVDVDEDEPGRAVAAGSVGAGALVVAAGAAAAEAGRTLSVSARSRAAAGAPAAPHAAAADALAGDRTRAPTAIHTVAAGHIE